MELERRTYSQFGFIYKLKKINFPYLHMFIVYLGLHLLDALVYLKPFAEAENLKSIDYFFNDRQVWKPMKNGEEYFWILNYAQQICELLVDIHHTIPSESWHIHYIIIWFNELLDAKYE